MIPSLIDIGSSTWLYLPPGIHDATLEEVKGVFANNPHRRLLFEGLVEALNSLKVAGCETVYLDGSYISSKPRPGDFDAVYELKGIDPNILDPVLMDFSNGRQAQKQKYLGEFLPNIKEGSSNKPFVEFFQVDKESGNPKGILKLDLTTDSLLKG